jgi:2-polyprenyl-3-methyl-5-hydroxy-6-metoxy-1,4-benzoquinol methylase
MRRLALGQRFDAVIAWHSLFHLPHDDQRVMFARFARLLNPGGMLMFTSGAHSAKHGAIMWSASP